MSATVLATYPDEVTADDWARIEVAARQLLVGHPRFTNEARVPLMGRLPPIDFDDDEGLSAVVTVRVARMKRALWGDMQTHEGLDWRGRPIWAALPVVVLVSPFPWLVCWEGCGPPPPVAAWWRVNV